ncbi:hypothetical protein [Amycolatopsis aidingensis]|nr:hypothetical protein [Amycolatopsis aidingensis]
MSEWAWVALGYGVTAVAVSGYLISLTLRWARVRRRTEGRQ